MKSKLWAMQVFLTGIFPFFSIFAEEAGMTGYDTEAIAIDSYIYGYPLVTMDTTMKVSTNVEKPIGSRAPAGQFANMRAFPNAQFNTVTAPNADTLYSVAWLNLANEPYILHLPSEDQRYFLMPMLSGWTDVFANPGTRTTGTSEAIYAITGPNWKGTLPGNLKELKSPTNLVWILGRTYTTGTPEDYKTVHNLQNQYNLIPLSSFDKAYSPPLGSIDPNIDMKTSVRDQVNNLSAEEFFNRLALLMIDNPPSSKDADIVAKMARIGIVPGKKLDTTEFAKIASAVKNVPSKAYRKIIDHQNDAGKDVNGWLYSLQTGNYGVNYLQRAFMTAVGLGANLPEDAVYPMTSVDLKGKPLDGTNKYTMHFNKGEEPPVKGFWSLTMYNDKVFFYDNPLNRYSLNSRDKFIYNPDGSLDFYIQNESPGTDKENNWLPAPKGSFILMLRTYWPESSILNGSWAPPGVQKVELTDKKVDEKKIEEIKVEGKKIEVEIKH